jgi:hypothetical protein
MSMQSDNKGRGLSNNLAAQMGLLAVAVVILLLIAAHYIW